MDVKVKLKPIFSKAVITLCGLLFSVLSHGQPVSASDFTLVPPLISNSTDPFVLISLSVELTQQAEAFTGAEQVYEGGTVCPGRRSGVSVCYTRDEEYIGYFDANKCYEYVTSFGSVLTGGMPNYGSANIRQLETGPDLSTNRTTDYFRPVGAATVHECSGNQFSGNFMNWATMTALDEFRYAMTGGARLVDTVGASAQTLLTRTYRDGSWGFVNKAISSGGIMSGAVNFINSPSRVTPFNISSIYIENDNGNNGNRVTFIDSGNNRIAELSVIVDVCNDSVGAGGIEENCVPYTDGSNTWYKPEGVLQENALNMRYALTSYSAHNDNRRNGGVLRANAKYIGYVRPLREGGIEVNPNAEINEFGQMVFHPDLTTLTDNGESLSGVNNSGVLNYINSFGLGPDGYKSYDPVSELYYEGLRYMMGLGPTPEYSGANGSISALTDNQKDNFPVITQVWDDPVLDACQSNFIVNVGDQFAWADGDLPGSSLPSVWGQPSGQATGGSDVGFNVSSFTNIVGTMEGMGGDLGNRWSSEGRRNTYYMAGMAYWARTQDVRNGQGGATDFDGDQNIKTFFVDTQEYSPFPPQREDNPFWLSAKYGSFDTDDGLDLDPNTDAVSITVPATGITCDSADSWDADSDCVPDGYTLASQPANLLSGLREAFNEIAERVNAGSAAGVVSNTSSGQGLVVQGLFKPKHTQDNNVVHWVGLLRALLIDEYDNYREDTNSDGQISNVDRVITFQIDTETDTATVSRHITSNGGATVGAPIETGINIEELDAVWDARDQLASLTDVTTQRSYGSVVGGTSGRAIYTSIDSDGDGITLDADVISFDSVNFPAISTDSDDRFRYLGLDSSSPDISASNIVNYIRGEEIAGFRSRTIDYDGDGDDEVWRLGDIITSSPIVVGAPKNDQRYDLLQGDDSYQEFHQRYRDRRQMVYVGANDGMLHAFNAGFFRRSNNTFVEQLDGEVAHPLGAELWAYVPFNALPHLRWLTELDYPHVYYVDGIPQTFDVNIFPDSTRHPNGWGTILVVGMRFGGGEIQLDPDSDDTIVDADNDDIFTGSAYMVLDVTDPERPPRLIAEITHPLMGYATSRPTVVKSRPQNSSGGYSSTSDSWYLVFGSGPYGSDSLNRSLALTDGVSEQDAKVFVFDLDLGSLGFVPFGLNDYLTVPNSANAFVGDFVAADWESESDGGYADDAVYFGTVSGGVSSSSGDLMRLRLGEGGSLISGASISRFVERTPGNSLDQPFSGLAFTRRKNGESWVFTGSGRFYNPFDQLNEGQMSYYGIREKVDSTTDMLTYDTVVLSDEVVDVRGIQVEYIEGESNGRVFNSAGSTPFNVGPDAVSVGTFNELKQVTSKSEQGWYFDFEDPSPDTSVQALHAGRSDGFGTQVAFTEYLPSGSACKPLGNTYLNFVHFQTGTASPFSAFGALRTLGENNTGANISDRSIYFSSGFVRDVEFVDGSITGQGSLGELVKRERPQEARVRNNRMSWREIIVNW